ncbi:putative mitochondrial carnitine O-acetyltransferase [Neolecta irregularis DAH-3]|uniref:Putative mitochondrial carnitine O-acetyltransferase n=1 Tax=Neolecta irregularis (strain DAH-3) TaxID=1198029 RepID=A0A1U7LMK0_NEOID|nr:putative mitochondrial carnitine O-acetyltransferase [Neolecta irregularis DAH-3]|eukprot:OLL23884.1 putative mitochondrial carnitine O-acetyltransferase [Neolecta irregularis DAH-3]
MSPGITFANQASLERLAIPDLADTCKRYLSAVKPLQTDAEHAETSKAVDEFLVSPGPELQLLLKEYAQGQSNYIEQFWYESYLNHDNPVVLNVNPFFLLEDDPTPARNDQVLRGASLVISALSFVRALGREELPPDTLRGAPLCMAQYKRLFGTTRVPTENGCQMHTNEKSRHIIVLNRAQFYYFDVLDENGDVVVTEKDLVVNFKAIIADSHQTPIMETAKGAVGVLTTGKRKVWAEMRAKLKAEPVNCINLQVVEDALFVVCLDDTSPGDASSKAANMLCGTYDIQEGVQVGTCMNRWYDKLQIIVCENGSAGVNFERISVARGLLTGDTGVDGHTVLRFVSDIFTDTVLRFAQSIVRGSPNLWTSKSPEPRSTAALVRVPHKLEWRVAGMAIGYGETRLSDLICQTEIRCLEFGDYGKDFITGNGLSPDAFVQMALQAAYYGEYGRAECVYEPAMTKGYLHGRTEAIRSLTMASRAYVQGFWGGRADRVAGLRGACREHVRLTRECSRGQGQDRHLYALYCMWQRQGGSAPGLFMDGGWGRLNGTVLSTSNCGNPSLRMFGFGPSGEEGFGIGYIIKEGSISVCASSKHRQTQRYLDTLEGYLRQVGALLGTAGREGERERGRCGIGRAVAVETI